jgi:hypothetical protein
MAGQGAHCRIRLFQIKGRLRRPTARVLASLRAAPPTGRLVCPRPIDHSHTCASVVSSRTSTGWLVLHEPDPGWFGALILATSEASTRMLAALVTSALTPPRPRKLLVGAPGAVPASP